MVWIERVFDNADDGHFDFLVIKINLMEASMI